MFIRVKTSPNSPRKAVQIVENVRFGDKIRQKIIRHVGSAMDEDELARLQELAVAIKVKLQTQSAPSLFEADVLIEMVQSPRKVAGWEEEPIPVDLKKLVEEQRIITGIHDVYGVLYRALSFDRVLGSSIKRKKSNGKLFQLVMARIAKPESKRGSVRLLERDFGISLSLRSVYKMMDKIGADQEALICKLSWQAAVSALGAKVNVLFYDCTTLYFESFNQDALKQFGYSKDNKFNQSQVMLALLVTADGLPVGYEVFPGASFEGNTLAVALENIGKRYEINEIFFVADSGMLSEKNLEMLEKSGKKYIVGARLKNLKNSLVEKILNTANYKPLDGQQGDEKQKITIANFDLPQGRKLIVTYNPSRAEKDKYDREKSVDQLKSKLEKSSNPLSLISNYGYKKFIRAEKSGKIVLNESKLTDEARWDGLHGVITNATGLTPAETIAHYHGLWQIEECFRLSKHDLQIRPVFHWTPERIKAHIAICFMALVCMRHLYNRVAKEYTRLSAEKIRQELLHIQVSILKNTQDSKRYALPSKPTEHARNIYKVMGLKPAEVPYKLKTS
jgi:transposase